jgi:hypothetical protein
MLAMAVIVSPPENLLPEVSIIPKMEQAAITLSSSYGLLTRFQ